MTLLYAARSGLFPSDATFPQSSQCSRSCYRNHRIDKLVELLIKAILMILPYSYPPQQSSGGKHHRFGITRQGNRYLRTAFIEANQRAYRTTKLSREVKARRTGVNPQYIAIADRCLRRLSKKGNRLLEAGKHPNKVKVACAREMIGFVWESLNKVAA